MSFQSFVSFLLISSSSFVTAAERSFSGIYPHLAFFNNEGECGTGAVVPWADRLWVITYAPHKPLGSSDKLYEITPDLQPIVRPESVGGTPANRMIHRESEQLVIGPYFIDKERKVRVIPPATMPGRHTGTARHLTDPANKVYVATMEEALYEVDVRTLAVTERIKDGNNQPAVGDGVKSMLPGYHGKGLYSGLGLLVYANNGENSVEARRDPFVPSGALATWDGSGDWDLVLRKQFTEVTGPGGIHGNESPANDPVWSVGWDAKSLILMCLHGGHWHRYRLPKASHSYDGAHGWNTEWPRIRDIGEQDLLMTMHGMFWRFPRNFTPKSSAGIAPRSTYLKVIGDFCRWQDRLVLGCDDTANKEFLNKRRIKGEIPAPQSQSNLWFIEPEQIDQIGPVIGRGAVWLNEAVEENVPSDPFLIDGFDLRGLHLHADGPVTVVVEVDRKGTGQWEEWQRMEVGGYRWMELDQSLDAVWMRLRALAPVAKATAWFHGAKTDRRDAGARPEKFEGVARAGKAGGSGGVLHARDKNRRDLHLAVTTGGEGYYVLDAGMNLVKTEAAEEEAKLRKEAALPDPAGSIEVDAASVVYVDDEGMRYRLPFHPTRGAGDPRAHGRFCREVATERDLFECFGTFYELPARNAGGFRRVRPISTHDLAVRDFCSYRGLLVLSGVDPEAAGKNPHLIRSDDGKTGLWVGTIDDLWSLGMPMGHGGPWKDTKVKAGQPSDPFLMTGYDVKLLQLKADGPCRIKAEVDITGMGDWQVYREFELTGSQVAEYSFPLAFQAYWIRFTADRDTKATAQLRYQ